MLLVLSMAYLDGLSLSTCCMLESRRPAIHGGCSIRKSFELSHSEYDDDEFVEAELGGEEDTDDFEDSFTASPLSQLQSDEDAALYRGTFLRSERGLENATEEILSFDSFPLGSLREDDVESIIGLMAAWVRRRSVDAALAVEKLLKRVVDDMRAHNAEVHVTTRMYTIVSLRNLYPP